MWKWIAVVAIALMAVRVGAAEATDQKADSGLKSDKEKTGYAIGVSIGTNLKAPLVSSKIEVESLIKGIRDTFAGTKLALTDDQIKDIMTEFDKSMARDQVKAMEAAAAKNKAEGEEFLAKNKSKEGVVTLPSGLQYKILKAGTGKKPTDKDTVVCNYRGTLIDGTEFDSSYSRNQPAEFGVTGVIAGWTEALKLMPVGSKWQLFVPSKLAYGDRGAGQMIAPNSTLIFEVELLSIK